ncbi:Uncharacterized protein APZ42_006075 [Daphnia magna]|uniref:Uncharacterized protein n=1 Tax=Daphnia magna TaxID=35525 RepID=A0A164G3L3_9CRUS|nr:Uncharacterized protein APZ42_006075 [Daphnia magna]
MQSKELSKHNEWVVGLGKQKETVSEKCGNVVNGAVENKMQLWLFEGCKRERSLKSVGTQSEELLRTVSKSCCLRAKKGNGLLKVLEHSQWSC